MLTIFALCLVAGIWVLPNLWFAAVRNKIELQTSFTPRYVVAGGEVRMQFTLQNKSWLPCPFVELAVKLPPGLAANVDETGRFVRFRTFLKSRQQMEAVVVCYAIRRGLQQMQHYPVYLTVHEGFGLKALYLERTEDSKLTIMPRFRPELARQPEFRSLAGKIERFYWIYQDESRLRGIRDYQPGDPLKYVAWQASASQGKWMTKQFSASTDASVSLLLNAQMFPDYWVGTRRDEFDTLCEMVATAAMQLDDSGFQLRLVTNAALLSHPRSGIFGLQSAGSIRTILGEVDSFAAQSFKDVFISYGASSPVHEGFLIFTSYEDEELHMLIDEERRRGRFVRVLYGPGAEIAQPYSEETTDSAAKEATI